MAKWKNTSRHWSKTEKRDEVLQKTLKYLRSDFWKGKKRDSNTIKKLNEGKEKWVKENPIKWKEKYEKMRKNYKGEKNPNWAGGKKPWLHREAKIRDDYICQICGLREPEIMEADHIKPTSKYPELKYEINNLITLCPNCHRRKTIRECKEKIYG